MTPRLQRRMPALLLLSGCAAVTPAYLQAPAADCLEQIEAFVEQDAGRAVRLGERSFAQSDILQLQPQVVRDDHGRPLDGRRLGRPQTFRLFEAAGVCTIEHARSGARQPIDACRCAGPRP